MKNILFILITSFMLIGCDDESMNLIIYEVAGSNNVDIEYMDNDEIIEVKENIELPFKVEFYTDKEEIPMYIRIKLTNFEEDIEGEIIANSFVNDNQFLCAIIHNSKKESYSEGTWYIDKMSKVNLGIE